MAIRFALACFAALLVSCASPSTTGARAEAARLRASFEKHRPKYLEAIELENRLVPETLEWLDGRIDNPSRFHACRLMDRWARAYFGPRVIHGGMRFDEYSSPQIKEVHHRMLEHLRQRYFVLHDYQRYAQRACESGVNVSPGRRLPSQLEEFRQRLRSHPPAVDEIAPVLDSLPR